MTETNPYREQLQDIDVDLAKEITRDSKKTHRVSIMPEGYRQQPDSVTVIEYRCTGYAAVVCVHIPKTTEYAYHGYADDVWEGFEAEIQAAVNEQSGKGQTIVEHNFSVQYPIEPEVKYPDNVSVEVIDE